MRTTILAYVIALGGVAMIAFGVWGLYILIKERVAERMSRRALVGATPVGERLPRY